MYIKYYMPVDLQFECFFYFTTQKTFRMIFYFCLLYQIESVYGQSYDRYAKQQNWNVPRVTSLEKLPPYKSNDIIGQERG